MNIESGKNYFISGPGGTGKSYTLRSVLNDFEDNKINCARTAMTGAASLQMPFGQTLHRALGLGIKTKLEDVVNSYHYKKEARFYLNEIDAISIDEVSMLRSDTLDLCDEVLKYARDSQDPFGGLQVILCGDLMQIPPVVKDNELLNFWCFESNAWESLELNHIYLRDIKRQDDLNFINALNTIRCGVVTPEIDKYFFNSHKNKFPEGIEPTKLMSTNKEITTYNYKKLSMLTTELETHEAEIWANDDFLKQQIIKDCPAEEKLHLKIGCQVMIIKNDSCGNYVNGSVGKYVGSETIPEINEKTLKKENIECLVVELSKDGKIVYVPESEWKIERKRNGAIGTIASFKQFPVKLGWAVTIHKSQGMTLDYVDVDLARCFGEGMAYVALSRARTYSGLRVKNWNKSVVKANLKAFNYYMGLKNKGLI